MENKLKPLISVIIPIYKAEKYIEKCVRCVLKQTYENLEIILVEDGSPDSSGVICDTLAAEDKRIRVIHKENGGAATARNAGLDIMTGGYVAFVDADDYMEDKYIETLYQTLVEKQAQVSVCGFKTIDENGNPVTIDNLHAKADAETENRKQSIKVFSGNDIILQDLQGHWEHVAPWGKLYQADLFEGVRYPSWPAFEDEHVFIQVFDNVDVVAVGTERLYYYVQHAGSLMNTAYNEKRRDTILKMWRERIAYYSDGATKHKQLYNPILQAFVAWNVLYLSMHAHEMTKEQKGELKGEICKYFVCLFQTPHLYSLKESMKLAVKCVLTLISTEILRKRYV